MTDGQEGPADEEGSSMLPLIAGAVIAIVIIVCIVYCVCRQKKKNNKRNLV